MTKKKYLRQLFITIFFIATLGFSNLSLSDEKEDLTVLRNTVVNLLQTLVDQGVMSQDQARTLVEQAQDKAEKEIAEAKADEQVDEPVVRVTYVPEIVKEEIRNQVRDELRAEVVADVVSHAERERWGIKDALPSWLNRIKISGDMRVRSQAEIYDSANPSTGDVSSPYFDVLALNDGGPFGADVLTNGIADGTGEFLNTDEDRVRERIRLRINLDAKINQSFSTRVRVSTGNTSNPVSTNQTLGEAGNPYDVVVDQAYIKFSGTENGPVPWLTFWAGRIPNPWVSTDLLWDDDLSFEGLAGTASFNLGGGEGLYADEHGDKEVFLTMGAFPLEEFSRSSNKDKWLLGGQIGTKWKFNNQSTLKIAAAYYDYFNVQADDSPRDVDDFLAQAPESLQKGNSVFSLLNPFDPDGLPNSGDETFLLGLASDYDLVNLTGVLDIANFAPYHLILTADYVKNIGYDSGEIEDRLGERISEKTEGYHLRADFGWPRVTKAGHWSVFGAYKHLERDAVLDAFTDSDFHLGGTDAEGWELGGKYGIADNTWLSLTWRTANEIDGPVIGTQACDLLVANCNLGIDVLQLDLNAKY